MEVLDNLKKTLGRRIRQIRKEAGLSAEELAESVSVHPNSIYTLERGENWISPETLGEICRVLGVHPYLLFIEDNLPAAKKIQAIATEAEAEVQLEDAWKSDKLRPLIAEATRRGVASGIRVTLRRMSEVDVPTASAAADLLRQVLTFLGNADERELGFILGQIQTYRNPSGSNEPVKLGKKPGKSG